MGAGPLPTEITEESDARRALQEVAATTGRMRRGGWVRRRGGALHRPTQRRDELFLTKLDVLSQFETIQVCVGYELEGRRVHYADLNAYELGCVKPLYRSLHGWKTDITGVRKYADLPSRARQYVETIERLVRVPVRTISVGPERAAVIKR